MGTVGINFGSATSGNGFDVASTVSAILSIQQGIETPWKNQLSALQSQDTVLSALGKDLATLTTNLQALTDFSGALSQMQGSSSDTNILGLSSADATAVAGSHTVVVSSLASTASEVSDAVKDATDTISGGITITLADGTSQEITTDDSSNTLASFAAAINSKDLGVTARIISDTSGSRLSLTSNTGGSAGTFTIDSTLSDTKTGASLGFNVGQVGADAKLNVDGIDMTSASNTITTAIPGVTFQILSANKDEPVQVVIANDTGAIATAFSNFVNAYNAVVADLNGQEGKDASGAAEPLSGSSTLALIQNQMASALLGGGASGAISSVTQLGISVNKDGTLTLDANALSTALNSHFADVTGFLQNAGSFGQNFATTLNSLGSSSTQGAVALAQQQNSAQEAALNQSISDQEDRIAAQKVTLTTELNEANQILQSIPQQLNEINQIYSAVTGFNQQK
ncbi:flagellar filament capping protein FliD [Granulicella sp. dw_53]|uniref:flagellar filament capping protein FliD n=1 Tax=Granulicella sp. dw_53 TaxID=2719792 RepID=UPI001BD3D062|nr:flagellar filament capping protein FliD [Granulicella sp. dw_53]